MNKVFAIFILSLICIMPRSAISESVYIFSKIITLPVNCVFYVNHKTFGCEDLNGDYASVSFSNLDEHDKEIKDLKVYKRTNPSLSNKVVVEIKSSAIQGKKHTLLVFNSPEEPDIYAYTICGEKNCISIYSSDMEFIRTTFTPISNQFVFWNPIDEDS